MAMLKGSFLVRCWALGDGDERIEIEHVQSGARTTAATLNQALDWIADQSVPASTTGLTKQARAPTGALTPAPRR